MLPDVSRLTRRLGFAGKIVAVCRDLEGHGFQPKVASDLRTLAQQRELVRKGFSKTMRSRHLANAFDFRSEAADIVDRRWGWDSPRSFWMKLASSARAHGLKSGIEFGLSRGQRKALWAAIDGKDWDAPVKIGWDPSHLQLP